MTQTEQLKTLPCSTCISNDVALHPAVAEGYVDPTFAAAFIDSTANTSKPTKKRKLSRDTTHGRCLTHQTEVDRLTKLETERKKKEEASLKRKASIADPKREKIEEITRKIN